MKVLFLVLLQSFSVCLFAQTGYDNSVIAKIREAERKSSQVMDIAFHLTDVSGPRLTGSPGFMRAAKWAKAKLSSWGLTNVSLEPWGEFGKGWEQERCYVAMKTPYYQSLIAVPKAWTGSTPGTGFFISDIILIDAKDAAGLMKYSGKLKNKIVMTLPRSTLAPSFTPDATRFDSLLLAKLDGLAPGETPSRVQPATNRSVDQTWLPNLEYQRTLTKLLINEKPALVLSKSGTGNNGTLFVGSGGDYGKNAKESPASVVLSSDDYMRLFRLIKAQVPVQLEANVKTRFYDSDTKGYNLIAEIPGADPELKDEMVLLGGHLDSWHGATGATDNAAGCAVMMEVVRLIKSLELQPRRTIRIILWSGEEQGLLGSRSYVKDHFGDRETRKFTPAHAKVSAYYNLDNGTGKIRGIYLQGNEKLKDIFKEWLKPFHDMGASTVTISNTDGTDHRSFHLAGIPGFQFIQDPIEYNTRTHHSNMDTYDHLIAEDLKQAATIVAAFVYNTAQRDDLLPRKR